MSLTIRHHGKVSVVELPARVTLGGGETEMRKAIQDLADSGRLHIIVNMEHLVFMDSTGLGQLMAAHLHVEKMGGMVKIVKPNQKKLDSFTIARFNLVFEVFEDEKMALTSFL
jgi:anti-anti-sigma factor